MSFTHPLQNISAAEIERARDVIFSYHGNDVISVREIFVQEPRKSDLSRYLDAEHQGQHLASSERPRRKAKCQYDVIGADKIPYYHEAVVDLNESKVVEHEIIEKESQASLTLYVLLR